MQRTEGLVSRRRRVLEVLDRSACIELLQSVAIGRVAWATESGDAVVVPVNFVAVEDGVVFRTAEGTKLAAAQKGRRLSFEADDVEPALHIGWSVLITGTAEVVTDSDEVRRLQLLPLAPWDPEPKPYFVRIRASEMTGRRLPLKAGGVTVEHSGDEPD
jgi:nitroimidazol reductase NimA-like FMN-containing flavoprotein (pyridoxamine 5'-phosphate oxidase superfamily)